MAAYTPTPDADAIVCEIEIAAPPERVFQALTDPAEVPQWWGQPGIYECKEFSADLRPGGKWRCSGVSADGRPFDIHGEYLEIIPARLLVSTWRATWTGDIQTKIRWELEPRSQGTLVRIRHSGFAAHPELAQAYRGWPRMLGWLQALLDRGETVSRRPRATWN